MLTLRPFIILGALVLSALPTQADDELARIEAGQPKDVIALIERITSCAHWAGEGGYDAARQAEIEKALRDLACNKLDEDRKAIETKYRKKKSVLKALKRADGFN
jgi:hypothetical protein